MSLCILQGRGIVRHINRMAQDGSQKWDDKGAFSYLMHHPKAPQHSESYRHSGSATSASSNSVGNTGTWDGPAPQGNLGSERRTNKLASTPSIQDSILLPGGGRLPLIGYGTYKIKSAENVRQAIEAGYRHIDCASTYDNQEIVGEGLQNFLGADSQNRSKLWITSKVWNDERKPSLIRKSIEKTLKDLNCEYLDLFLIHWPDAWQPGTKDPDPEGSIKDTWQTLETLVDEGKTRHIGVSNFSLTDIEELLEYARIKPVVNQIELHPSLAQRKLVGTSLRKGVYSVAYSPLGHGDLTMLDYPEVQKISKEQGCSPAQVLLKWNVQRGVPVIPRSSRKENMKANIKGLFDWELSPEQKASLDGLDTGERKVDASWHSWDDPALGGARKPSDSY